MFCVSRYFNFFFEMKITNVLCFVFYYVCHSTVNPPVIPSAAPTPLSTLYSNKNESEVHYEHGQSTTEASEKLMELLSLIENKLEQGFHTELADAVALKGDASDACEDIENYWNGLLHEATDTKLKTHGDWSEADKAVEDWLVKFDEAESARDSAQTAKDTAETNEDTARQLKDDAIAHNITATIEANEGRATDTARLIQDTQHLYEKLCEQVVLIYRIRELLPQDKFAYRNASVYVDRCRACHGDNTFCSSRCILEADCAV